MTDQTIAAPAPSQIIGYAYAAAGAALFSSKAIFIKLAYLERSDASLMLASRMAFSLPFFIVIGLYAFNKRRQAGLPAPGMKMIALAAVNGFIGYYIASYLDFAGLLFITAQLERLVLFTYPVFVMLLGFMFFGGRITAWARGRRGSRLLLGASTLLTFPARADASDLVVGEHTHVAANGNVHLPKKRDDFFGGHCEFVRQLTD